jgi:hypothetical protein
VSPAVDAKTGGDPRYIPQALATLTAITTFPSNAPLGIAVPSTALSPVKSFSDVAIVGAAQLPELPDASPVAICKSTNEENTRAAASDALAKRGSPRRDETALTSERSDVREANAPVKKAGEFIARGE